MAAPCKNNLGTRWESGCILVFSKAKRGQRVTDLDIGRKSRRHWQPFTLSKQTRTSLAPDTHAETQASCLTQTLQLGLHQGGRVKSQRCARGAHWAARVALHASPRALRPSGVSPQPERVGRRSGETWAALFWNKHRDTGSMRTDRQGTVWMPLKR